MGNYKVNGADVVAPNNLHCEWEMIAKAWRDAGGIMHIIPLRLIKKVNWKYTVASKAEIDDITKKVYTDVVIAQKTADFTITTEFMGLGAITSTFYLGSPQSGDSIFGTGTNGVEQWSFEIHWIETAGIKLRSITDIPANISYTTTLVN